MKIKVLNNGVESISIDARSFTEKGDALSEPVSVEAGNFAEYESAVPSATIKLSEGSEEIMSINVVNDGETIVRLREEGEDIAIGAAVLEPGDSCDIETLNVPAVVLVEELMPDLVDPHP